MQRIIVSVCMLGLLPGALLAQEPEPELAMGPVTLAGDSLHGPVRSVEWRIPILGEEDRVIRTWYDRQGRRTEQVQVEDGVTIQRWRYNYDEQGRRSGMELESRLPSGETSLQRYTFLYDPHGRVTAQLIGAPESPEPSRYLYERDEHGRLVKVVYDASGRKEYRYDAAGNRVLEAYFNGTGREYARHELSYDTAGRLVCCAV
ncbi:MAG TPA: RHS repeat domain-containing protein [Longimicrobium sp.]|nr:RHS repeat domain-containing protein [Longimicrobium sp.]